MYIGHTRYIQKQAKVKPTEQTRVCKQEYAAKTNIYYYVFVVTLDIVVLPLCFWHFAGPVGPEFTQCIINE